MDAPEDVPTSTMYDVGEPDAAPHDNATLEPLTAAVRLPGTDGEVHGVGVDDGLVKLASFDAAPEPPAFAARTRTKYVPAPMPLVEKLVAVEPVLKFARFERPDADPASSTYPVGVQPEAGAIHERVTDVPLAAAERLAGAPGAAVHAPPATTRSTSLDVAPEPPLFFARTRTKYEPAGTPVTVSVTAALPVSKLARSNRPLAEPASTT